VGRPFLLDVSWLVFQESLDLYLCARRVKTDVEIASLAFNNETKGASCFGTGYDYLRGVGLGRNMQEAVEAQHLDADQMVANSFQGGNPGNPFLEKARGEDGRWHYNKEGPRKEMKVGPPSLACMKQLVQMQMKQSVQPMLFYCIWVLVALIWMHASSEKLCQHMPVKTFLSKRCLCTTLAHSNSSARLTGAIASGACKFVGLYRHMMVKFVIECCILQKQVITHYVMQK
jgi:hypothetical protein